jgi:hypothetical protein
MIDPMKDMCAGLDWLTKYVTPAMIQLTASKDAAISQALSEIQPLWTKEEIARRCVFLRTVGSEVETLHVDGVPVLVFYPGETTQEWKEDRIVLTHTQKYKRVRVVQVGEAGNG